jgi:hypothetical protein
MPVLQDLARRDDYEPKNVGRNADMASVLQIKIGYDLRDPLRGFLSCDWRILAFFRFGLLMANVPLP